MENWQNWNLVAGKSFFFSIIWKRIIIIIKKTTQISSHMYRSSWMLTNSLSTTYKIKGNSFKGMKNLNHSNEHKLYQLNFKCCQSFDLRALCVCTVQCHVIRLNVNVFYSFFRIHIFFSSRFMCAPKKERTSFIETIVHEMLWITGSMQRIEWSSKTILMSHLFNLHAMYSILNGSVLCCHIL